MAGACHPLVIFRRCVTAPLGEWRNGPVLGLLVLAPALELVAVFGGPAG